MKQLQPDVFAKLHPKIFGGGSSFQGLKAGEKSDIDIDILLTLPKITNQRSKLKPNIPGYVQLRLQNFHALENKEPKLYNAMAKFVDRQNYLRADRFNLFFQSLFDKIKNHFFPDGLIKIGKQELFIKKVVNKPTSPAVTLTIQQGKLELEIDLVPCILLGKNYWPQGGFCKNPVPRKDKFFLVPKHPKGRHPHIERNFQLSFQIQEQEIIRDKQWMKPSIRIIKLINKHFNNKVSGHAIKTLFMLEDRNFLLNHPHWKGIPEIWTQSFSSCLIHMLERYLQCLCLTTPKIPNYWNKNHNLLDNLNDEQLNSCRNEIRGMLNNIINNPDPETIFTYLEVEE